jgi:hypothetical protein
MKNDDDNNDENDDDDNDEDDDDNNNKNNDNDNDYDNDNNNNYNNDDDDDDNDNDAKDEYKDVAGRFFACVDATMAKIQAMDDGFENRAAAREKAWADELRQMATWENTLAD